MDRELTTAIGRIDAFIAVQGAGGRGFTPRAVECLQEAVGLGPAERKVLAQWLQSLPATGAGPRGGAVLLGIIVGLMAAQEDSGADERRTGSFRS
jgi:fructose-specific phosphotransferase system IIC component